MMSKRQRFEKIKFEQDGDDKCLPFFFDLPAEQLVLVDDYDKLCLFVKVVGDAVVIGIDTETEPQRKQPGTPNKTSLMQLAVRSSLGEECVFILDIQTIFSSGDMMVLADKALAQCLNSSSVIKVGHALKQDLCELVDSYPDSSAFQCVRAVVETNALHQILNPNIKREVSLKYLTRNYLHGNLVKSQQCSSWGSRPLSESQIHYAACDALVLLRLYDAIYFEIEDLFGTFDVATVCVDFDDRSLRRSPNIQCISLSPNKKLKLEEDKENMLLACKGMIKE